MRARRREARAEAQRALVRAPRGGRRLLDEWSARVGGQATVALHDWRAYRVVEGARARAGKRQSLTAMHRQSTKCRPCVEMAARRAYRTGGRHGGARARIFPCLWNKLVFQIIENANQQPTEAANASHNQDVHRTSHTNLQRQACSIAHAQLATPWQCAQTAIAMKHA